LSQVDFVTLQRIQTPTVFSERVRRRGGVIFGVSGPKRIPRHCGFEPAQGVTPRMHDAAHHVFVYAVFGVAGWADCRASSVRAQQCRPKPIVNQRIYMKKGFNETS